MNYDQIIRNALRLAKAPRRFASGGEVVPKKMGTSPIPKGMVRRFHVTGSQNIDDIKKNGLTMQRARGIDGPKAIYSWSDEDSARSYAGPYGSIVEFYDHPENYDSHRFARLGDVPKDQILAIHEPWHERYRYALEENIPSTVLRDAGGPDYEKAADALDKSRGYALGGEADSKDISPSISNPVSVFPKPQRMFPADAPVPGGQYLGMPDKEDMTGHKSAVASIGVHPGGKPYFNASKDAVDQTGTAGKAKTKTNLFKQKAGWSWQNAPEGHEDTNTIVSVEHLGKHYYALNAHFPKGVDFARYEKAKSEPRLRPTTTGDVFLGPQAGTIIVRGKEHPVYHHVVVKADGGAVGYASGGDAEPYYPVKSKEYEENLSNFMKDSHIVDKKGKPIRLFHGTSDKISYFNLHHPNRKDAGWLGEGVYLSESPIIASNYATQKPGSENPNVMPLYVRMTNPYRASTSDKQRLRMIELTHGKDAARAASSEWTNYLKSKGHDGVIYEGPISGSTEYVVFDPENVKSAIGNRGTFDRSTDYIDRNTGGSVGYASGGDADQPRQLDDRGFYSAAAEAARSLPQAKGSPSQMMATMKGVKPSELEWSGAGNAFANQKTVTRDDLAQHFEKNVPKIRETVNDYNKYEYEKQIRKTWESEIKQANDYLNHGNEDDKNWARQQLQNIENQIKKEVEYGMSYRIPKYSEWTLGSSYGNESPEDRNYREILLRLDHPDTLHKSSHWASDNVIAHLRMQDRGPNNDVLHLEELQSDWAQKGRDEGFFTKEDLIKREAAKKSFEEYSKELADKYGLNPRLNLAMYRSIAGMHDSEVEKYEQLQREAIITGAIIKNKKINPAPYVTNTDHWTELALKRVLIEAARGGYNKLVWTPGEEQAKRYSLGNYVDTLLYRPDTKKLIGYNEKNIVFSKDGVEKNDLKNYIGEELANKIMHEDNVVKRFNGETLGHALEGQQLFMGGKGMTEYYGKILPNALRRVLKPHADKIQPTSHVVKNNDGEDVTLPGIEITPEMRESILKKGFAHYAHGGEVRQHFEVGGGADGGDSGGGDSSNGDGGGFSSNSDMADFGSQTEREDSSPAAPSYSPTDQDPSMLGGATGMAFSPLGSGSLGVGTGRVSGSVFGNAEQNLNTGPGVVGFIGGSPLGALAYAMKQINNTYYDGKARADVDQNVGGPSSGQNPTAADVVYPQSANPSGGFRLSSDDDETQAGLVKPVAFAPPAPPMMASGGKARNSHPVLSIPGVHIREEIHGRPIFLGEEFGKFSSGGDVPKNKNEGIIVSDNHKGKIPDVNYLVKNKNRFIYHSSPADPNDLKHGIDPMSAESGTWTSENMDSEDYGMSESEYEEYKESLPKASWYSRKPEWVKTIAARKLGKHENELMEDDIKNHGHLALVHKKDLKDYNIYWVGDDFHHTEEVTDPYGKRKKVWSTPLHSYSDIFGNLTVPGIEENEYVSTDSIEPFVQLTGDALVEFLKKTGNL